MILNNENSAARMHPGPVNAYGDIRVNVYANVPVTSGYSYSIVPSTEGNTVVALATALNTQWGIAPDSIASGEYGELMVEGYVENAYGMATAGQTYVPGESITWGTSGSLDAGGATFTMGMTAPVGLSITTSEESTLYCNFWKFGGGIGINPSTTT